MFGSVGRITNGKIKIKITVEERDLFLFLFLFLFLRRWPPTTAFPSRHGSPPRSASSLLPLWVSPIHRQSSFSSSLSVIPFSRVAVIALRFGKLPDTVKIEYLIDQPLKSQQNQVLMAEETFEHRSSVAATFIFTLVLAFHFVNRWFEHEKKRASKNSAEVQIRAEIKKLLREASTLSQPSTFAQASKLRRQAAAKEKELSKMQESVGKEIQNSYDTYLKAIFLAKVFTYIVLVFWFWRTPVAVISKQLVQPFGKLLSWGSGGTLGGNVMVGIIPWLILSTRVSRFVFKLMNW